MSAIAARARRQLAALAAGLLAVALLTPSTAALAPVAAAGVPANDNFANAIDVSAHVPYTQAGLDNSAATIEASEPAGACQDPLVPIRDHSIWYRYVPTVAGALRAVATRTAVVGNEYQPGISVYTGSSLGSLARLACGRQDLQSGVAETAFVVRPGTIYYVQVASESNLTGQFTFSLQAQAPSADFFAFASDLSAKLPYTEPAADTTHLTSEPGEPAVCGGDTFTPGTVWYRYIASVTTTLSARTVPAVADAMGPAIDVFEGTSLADLSANRISCYPEFRGPVTIDFQARAGHTYYVRLASLEFPRQFSFTLLPVTGAVPPNDAFANATDLGHGVPFVAKAVSIALATTQPAEPTGACAAPGRTVWYRFTPSVATAVSARAAASRVTGNVVWPVLAAYEGTAMNALTRVGCSAGPPGGSAWVTFAALPGHTYYLQAGSNRIPFWPSGAGPATSGVLDIALVAQTPPNDFFATATDLSAAVPYSVTGINNLYATIEKGEPTSCDTPTHDFWYRYVAPLTTTMSVHVVASQPPGNGEAARPFVGVFEGSTLAGLARVACVLAVNQSATAAFPVQAGHTYYLQVDGDYGRTGLFALTLADQGAPAVTTPVCSLRSGVALGTSGVRPTCTWIGTTRAAPILGYDVQRSTDGGAWTTIAPASTASVTPTLTSGHVYRIRIRAVDVAGRTSWWSTSATIGPAAYQESSSRIAYRGTWTRLASTAYYGGADRYARARGASASFTFTGRSVAWIARRGPTSGSAKVYVNGTYVKTVSLYASTTAYRRVVWSANWSSARTRTIKIVVVGTAGHPRVDVDGFTILK